MKMGSYRWLQISRLWRARLLKFPWWWSPVLGMLLMLLAFWRWRPIFQNGGHSIAYPLSFNKFIIQIIRWRCDAVICLGNPFNSHYLTQSLPLSLTHSPPVFPLKLCCWHTITDFVWFKFIEQFSCILNFWIFIVKNTSYHSQFIYITDKWVLSFHVDAPEPIQTIYYYNWKTKKTKKKL